MTPRMRSLLDTDKAFIYSTWLRGLYHGDSWYNQIDKTSFFTNYAKVVDVILSRPDTTVRVLCDPEDEDTIYGYIILGQNLIHWCHVKEPWRLKGYANLLLGNQKIDTVTHVSKPGNAIRKKNVWTFDPFKI